MEELESQIAKIQIGNFKNTNNYVYVSAEKAAGSQAELYVMAELPLLNPAAQESCEQICLAIAAALKRAYKRAPGEYTFESAVAQINDELAKLVSLGQTQWVDKLNCIVGVKDGRGFTIASCGKVSAFLYRGKEFTDISCSSKQSHPVKTFENYAAGKLRLGDVLILSNTQLFNHVSMDRLRDIFEDYDFLSASQMVIEILKENAGPTVAFGTIFNKQVPPGQTPSEEIDLENYTAEAPRRVSVFSKAGQYISSAFGVDRATRAPNVKLPKISFAGGLKSFSSGSRSFFRAIAQSFAGLKEKIRPGKSIGSQLETKKFSLQKKIFLASVAVLLLAFIANVLVANHIKKSKQTQADAANGLRQAQDLLTKAQSSILFNDMKQARAYITQAEAQIPKADSVNGDNKSLYDDTRAQLADIKRKVEKIQTADVASLGSLGFGDALLALPQYEAVQAGSNIVSFNKQNSQIQDGALKSSETIKALVPASDSTAVIYNGQALLVWDFQKALFGPAFTQSVPSQDDFAGLAYYPVTGRVYLINKKTNQLISFIVTGRNISKPTVVNKSAEDFSKALDIAIDTSVYVLSGDGIRKYSGGVLQDFSMPPLYTPFSGSGKIDTQNGFADIYVLDSGNNRILVIDKQGSLVRTLVSDQFTKLKDFAVDEKNKTIYVLNENTLLKVALP